MFLHSGAGLHGHEYSAQRQQSNLQPNSRPFPLLRSALRSHTDTGDLRRVSNTDSIPRQRSLSAPRLSSDLPSRKRPVSEALSKKDLAVRFVEPQMEQLPSPAPTTPYSEDESVAASDFSDHTEVSSPRRRRKRAPRQSARYALCQPAPQHRTKQRMLVQIRPRLLLQLQQLNSQRPVPVLDVLPSSIVSGSIIVPRLAKRFPRVFHARPNLGHDDLLLVRSEDYNAPSTEVDGDSRRVDDQDLSAIVSPLPHRGDDYVEIVMEDGSVWTSTPLANGSYEFTRVTENGIVTTARWVKRAVRVQTAGLEHPDQPSLPSPVSTEYKYTFSVIDPSTRRHPILGVLRSNELEIFDSYNTMSASSGRHPPTKAFGGSIGNGELPRSPKQEHRATERVSEEHKQLMSATAIWIGLRQMGWPATASPKARRAISHCQTSFNEYTDKGRRSSWFGVSAVAGATSPTMDPLVVSQTPAVMNNTDGLSDRPVDLGPPRRALSTGAQFMRRRRMNSLQLEDRLEFESKRPPDAVPVRAVAVGDAASVRDSGYMKDAVSAKDVRVLRAMDDEKTGTCRTRLRRLTQRIFRRTENLPA